MSVTGCPSFLMPCSDSTQLQHASVGLHSSVWHLQPKSRSNLTTLPGVHIIMALLSVFCLEILAIIREGFFILDFFKLNTALITRSHDYTHASTAQTSATPTSRLLSLFTFILLIHPHMPSKRSQLHSSLSYWDSKLHSFPWGWKQLLPAASGQHQQTSNSSEHSDIRGLVYNWKPMYVLEWETRYKK